MYIGIPTVQFNEVLVLPLHRKGTLHTLEPYEVIDQEVQGRSVRGYSAVQCREGTVQPGPVLKIMWNL